MNEEDFEGSLVLEKLAEIGEQEAFFDAVDSDDFRGATQLMRRAGVDEATIQQVLKQMRETTGV